MVSSGINLSERYYTNIAMIALTCKPGHSHIYPNMVLVFSSRSTTGDACRVQEVVPGARAKCPRAKSANDIIPVPTSTTAVFLTTSVSFLPCAHPELLDPACKG